MININIIIVLLFISVAISLSVVSISIIVLILLNKDSVIKSLGYIIGWALGMVVIAMFSYYFLDTLIQLNKIPQMSNFTLEKILMGIFFILVSIKLWDSRPKTSDEIPHSRIFDEIEKLNFIKASILAFVLQITNVKNITLVFCATYILVSMDIHFGIEIVLIILFLFISCFTLLLPLLFIVIMGERIRPTLFKIKNWLLFNNKAILAVMLFVAGLFIIIENLIIHFTVIK